MSTSWETISNWYDRAVGEKGHYFHEHVILPRLVPLLESPNAKVLELGCGQGVLARALPKGTAYCGIDISPSLIASAKQGASPKHKFLCADATKNPTGVEAGFTHAVFLLSMQNIEEPVAALTFAAEHLAPGGRCVLVINHPCFRIPRQSSWQLDEKNKILYRRLDRYLSPLKIPIAAHPSKKDSAVTWSFHHSLSEISSWLKKAGFLIEEIQEWCSDKSSEGKGAKMENRARDEFPLFLTLVAKKS